MEIFRYIFALYIFLAALLAALAFATALSFPQVKNYAYSAALVVHSVSIFVIFVQELRSLPDVAKDKGEKS